MIGAVLLDTGFDDVSLLASSPSVTGACSGVFDWHAEASSRRESDAHFNSALLEISRRFNMTSPELRRPPCATHAVQRGCERGARHLFSFCEVFSSCRFGSFKARG
jgi:hypothetical protein